MVYLILICFFIIPPVLTCMNIYNLFAKVPVKEKLNVRLTFTLGPLFMYLLWNIWCAPDWDIPLYINHEPYIHTPLASWHMPSILALAGWALLSFWIIHLFRSKLPPLLLAICLSGTEAGITLSVIFIIQLAPHLFSEGVFMFTDVFFMALFPLNYLICLPPLLRPVIAYQVKRFQEAPPKNNLLLELCRDMLSSSLGWIMAGFIIAIPILALLLAVLVMFGQAPDAAIRAFTETSDWTLSAKTSPPPLEWQHDHYLCTVAIGGHPGLVKPTRYGIRRGRTIVVNRQLCVANAFEDLIQQRWPRFHKAIRYIYDTYGYPISKHITSPFRADITYIIMKPLEWLFLLFLYSFDQRPENRIALQYTGKKTL